MHGVPSAGMRSAVAGLLVLLLAGCGFEAAEQESAASPSATSSAGSPSPSLRPTRSPAPSPTEDLAARALTLDCSAAQSILTEVNDAATKAGSSVVTTTDAAATFQAKQAALEELATQSLTPEFAVIGQALADRIGMVRVALLQGGDVGGAVNGYLEATSALVKVCQG